jgi:hypothetical protein
MFGISVGTCLFLYGTPKISLPPGSSHADEAAATSLHLHPILPYASGHPAAVLEADLAPRTSPPWTTLSPNAGWALLFSIMAHSWGPAGADVLAGAFLPYVFAQ